MMSNRQWALMWCANIVGVPIFVLVIIELVRWVFK